MKATWFFFIGIILAILNCAAPAKFVITGKTYPPYSGPVDVLYKKPIDKKIKAIGLVSSSGGTIHDWTHLIEAMQKKAAKYGANAIIILKEDQMKTAFLTYTKQLGMFAGTGDKKSMMAIAVKISGVTNTYFYDPENKFHFGVESNVIPYIFEGYNGSIWFGKKGFRLRGEISKINTPDAYWRDGFEKDRSESYGLNIDYFPLSEFDGFWTSIGFFDVKGSLGHEDELERGNYEFMSLQMSLGYLININKYLYLNAGAIANFHVVGDKEIIVGNKTAVFDEVTPAISLSVGVNF